MVDADGACSASTDTPVALSAGTGLVTSNEDENAAECGFYAAYAWGGMNKVFF